MKKQKRGKTKILSFSRYVYENIDRREEDLEDGLQWGEKNERIDTVQGADKGREYQEDWHPL